MALDPLEKEQLRKKMALRMVSFLESASTISCVSGHFYFEPHLCDLCQETHANEILVVKNRSGKKLMVAAPCLREMVRFRVVEVDDLPRWLLKLTELKSEAEKRRKEQDDQRREERKKLEKKVILRKRTPA
jgi:hypothetical protein